MQWDCIFITVLTLSLIHISIKDYALTRKTDSYYDQVSRYLLYMKETIGIKYFYVVIPCEDHMYYIDVYKRQVLQSGAGEPYHFVAAGRHRADTRRIVLLIPENGPVLVDVPGC